MSKLPMFYQPLKKKQAKAWQAYGILGAATPEEIEQALSLGVTTLGFPAMMAALAWAQAAMAAHTP